MITSKGYIRITHNGKLRMEHDVVWEKANGKIPDGHDVHHKDFNKQNNALENLELLTKKEHKRIHSGWQTVDGKHLKPCKKCGVLKEEREFYKTAGKWPEPECKQCRVARSVKDKKLRKRDYVL